MVTIELAPKGPFDLRLLAGFGFGPTTETSEPTEPVMRLAFCLDDLHGHAGALLRQDDDGIAESWRPFRSWATVLLRYAGERDRVI
jgi:hypothetical protein